MLLLAFGPRRGEALALRWDALDLTSGVVHIRATVSRVGGSLVVESPKNRSERSWPLAPSVVEVLKAHRREQAAQRLRMGSAWQENGLAFPSELGTYAEPRNISRAVARIARRAGIGNVTPHVLRHTCGSHALAAGVDLVTVSRMLGHSSVAITGDIYSHQVDSQRQDAADALAARLGLGLTTILTTIDVENTGRQH